MNKVAKEVRDYWLSQNGYFQLDSEILGLTVESLSEAEKMILGKGKDACRAADDRTWQEYLFVVNKAFNRHNDLITGATTIDGTDLIITKKSSISELDISLNTLITCNRACIYHIEDVDKKLLPKLSFEAIADVTAAIIEYNNSLKE